MMWDLPVAVEINGKNHPIRNKCDYRVVLDVICALNDNELTEEEKVKFDETVGLVEASIGRMVPVQTDEMKDGEPMRVVRIVEHMAMYEKNHVNKVGDAAYQNMKSALAKIKSKTELYE